jgi:hypothetical protein
VRIGIIRYWVGRSAAEHETIERFKIAANMIDHQIVELRPDGKTLEGTVADVDFIINLHFASGKSTSDITYGALWNPWSFYQGWGFEKTFANQISNDFLVSCGAKNIDSRFQGTGIPTIIPQMLSHTVPPVYKLPEVRTDRKLFYIGINWEKSSNTHGRHHELLKELDKLGILEIYGPTKLGHIRPWKGFKGFRGDLPFDGLSVIDKCHEVGAVLVLSSQEHLKDQIQTSRLFEGLAGGAAIVGDQHHFMNKNFKNEIWQFDNSNGVKEQALEIASILNSINASPSDTNVKVVAGQRLLEQNFNLASQLDGIANHARAQIEKKQGKKQRSATALVLLDTTNDKINTFIDSLFVANFNKVIVISNHIPKLKPSDIVVLRCLNSNSSYSEFIDEYLLLQDCSEFLTLFTGHEEVFPTFLESIDTMDDSQVAVLNTGACLELDNEYYSNAINAKSISWNCQPLASLVIKKSFFEAYLREFQSFSIHCVLNLYILIFENSHLVKVDPLVRFSYAKTAPNLGDIQGIDFHKLKNTILGNWSPVLSTKLNQQVTTVMRANRTTEFNMNDGVLLATTIYKALRTPQWLTRMLKRFRNKIFR